MSDLSLLLLVLSLAAVLLSVLGRSEKVFEFPYFMAAVFAVFIMPQAVSLNWFPGRVSSSAVDDILLMTCLCFGACVLGYQLKPSRFLTRLVWKPLRPERMFHVGCIFIGMGYLFGFLLGQIRVEMNLDRGGMTGVGTILLFFATLKYPGLAICFALFLQRPTLGRLLMVLIGSVSPVGEVILGGRREPAVALGLIFFLNLYFYRRFKPPVVLIYGAMFIAMLVIPATGNYRIWIAEGTMKDVSKINLMENFRDYFGKESILELRNAAAIIESTRTYGDYEYGAAYWNQLVFRFVPAQLVGKETKDSLLIDTTVESMFKRFSNSGYDFSVGTTYTGMGDSFKQFGWFGCLFFGLLAIVFRSLWTAALIPNAFFAQLLYLLIATSAMRAVTHQTADFLPGFLYQFGFLYLGAVYAAERRTNEPTGRKLRPARQLWSRPTVQTISDVPVVPKVERRGDEIPPSQL